MEVTPIGLLDCIKKLVLAALAAGNVVQSPALGSGMDVEDDDVCQYMTFVPGWEATIRTWLFACWTGTK